MGHINTIHECYFDIGSVIHLTFAITGVPYWQRQTLFSDVGMIQKQKKILILCLQFYLDLTPYLLLR